MGLLDIAPPEIVGKRFEIRGGILDVRGIKNREWVELLKRFPDIQKMLNGDGMNVVDVYSSATDGLISAIIAAGLGQCGNTETENLITDRLSEAEQFAIFEEIMELGAADKVEAKRKLNSPLAVSPETGKLLNGKVKSDQSKTSSQQPSLL